MAVGTNIKYTATDQIIRKVHKKMNLQQARATHMDFRISYKKGIPSNNTVADNPRKLGDLCYDITNNQVYRCSVYSADASATTWVKITA